MGRRRCCCPPPAPTGVQVTVSMLTPCAMVPGDAGSIVVKRSGSVVATAPFTVPPPSGGIFFGASAVFNLPFGSGYTAEFASDPARFVKTAGFGFTVPTSGPVTRSGDGATVHPDYVCFSTCRPGSGGLPRPPLPKTLHLTDSVWGAATLAYTNSGGVGRWEGSKAISVGLCDCPTLGASIGYRWPAGAAGNTCGVLLTSSVRSDLCFSSTPTPENPSLFVRQGVATADAGGSSWPLLTTATFNALSCDFFGTSAHMPYPGGTVTYEITE